ncbi:hypothetical protein BC940DRAFT_370689 [Gongronella butleri]|nr:hypothetical protein BC940DRAFT_370689 [Gongronella butleri]
MDFNLFQPPSDEEKQEWNRRLVGKYILDADEPAAMEEDQVVRTNTLRDPKQVLLPNAPMTRDYIPNRMNIFVTEDKRCESITFC